MSHTSILAGDSTIHNFISKMCPPLYFSEPARKHIANFITGASQKGYHFIGGLKTNPIIYPQGIRTS